MNTIEDTILKRNVPGRWQNENIDECKDSEGFKSIESSKNQSSVVSYLSSQRNNKTGVKGIYILTQQLDYKIPNLRHSNFLNRCSC